MIILDYFFVFLILPHPPRSTRSNTLFPYTMFFRSEGRRSRPAGIARGDGRRDRREGRRGARRDRRGVAGAGMPGTGRGGARRSEEHTSELQKLMRISYAGFCWKKKRKCRDNRYLRQQKKKQLTCNK